ncbi:AAA family ATPase [Salmonella enterica]|nr:AAA family ATPase [Salmonella enterica]EFS4370634.1 AAA family ATPase [Salmonella enterica]EHU0461813.1 AAA family ATPase [Salmonella enterica]EIL0605939.1 AAA family ATPase [Salmonella enterica]ELP9051066.1 AAA family ATPase [Salmonella enterica]
MIRYFSGCNYKAFKEFKIELKPLTILLGANSCGKSAILNSFFIISQSIDSSSQSGTPLRLNGNRVGMGEALNVIKDKNPENELSFSFEVDDLERTKDIINSLKRDCVEAHFTLARYLFQRLRHEKRLNTSLGPIMDILDDLYYRADSYNTNQLKSIAQKITSILREFRKNYDIKDNPRQGIPSNVYNFANKVSFKKISECLTQVLPISSLKLAAKKITLKFKYHPKDKELYVSECLLLNEQQETIFSLAIDVRGDISLKSDVVDNNILRLSRKDFKKLVNLKSLIIFDNDRGGFSSHHQYVNDLNNPLAVYLSRVVGASLREIKMSFSGQNVNHVSPLRAFPQRYYLLDKAIYHKQLNAMDGTELAEILKNRPDIKKSINELMIKFNITVEVEKVNDIIHKITVLQESVKLELTDVGFGISQVLPILVQAFLSPSNSITIIEQPEIHLHPKMQAWLTDALIHIAMNNDKIFIVETHSDALVRRLRLRIVDEDSGLTDNHVAIYYLERNRSDNKTEVNEVKISPDGDISWPSEFMDVEINDTLMIQKKKIEKMMKNNQENKDA